MVEYHILVFFMSQSSIANRLTQKNSTPNKKRLYNFVYSELKKAVCVTVCVIMNPYESL
jgi:hypothetical protein